MADVAPQKWTRETPWRQGHVLRSETASRLDLVNSGADACAIVISHDCDLSNDNLATEPDVELIVGKVLPTSNGSFTWGKSPRTLHLQARRGNSPVALELVATKKRLAPKTALAGDTPDTNYFIGPKELEVLQYWLSVRYRRAAFSDTFVGRMASTGLDKRLAKRLDSYSIISAVYFDVDDDQEVDRSDGTPYNLSIVLTVAPEENWATDMDIGDAAEKEVEKLFSEKCYDQATDTWKHFTIKACLAISEDDISVSKARLLKQWRLEHVSFKAGDNESGTIAVHL
jgi:hypothetical protein